MKYPLFFDFSKIEKNGLPLEKRGIFPENARKNRAESRKMPLKIGKSRKNGLFFGKNAIFGKQRNAEIFTFVAVDKNPQKTILSSTPLTDA